MREHRKPEKGRVTTATPARAQAHRDPRWAEARGRGGRRDRSARRRGGGGRAVRRRMCVAAHVTRLPPAQPPAPRRQLADVEGPRRRRRRPASEARGLPAPVSAHLARGRAPGCVTLSRCSGDARGEGPSTPPPWVCGECGCVRVAPRRWLWCPQCAWVECRCVGGVCVAAFVGPSGCVPFVSCPFSANVVTSGLLCGGGSSPFVCALPAACTPSVRSVRGRAPARARGHAPVGPLSAPLCLRRFFSSTAWAPPGVWVAPPFVSLPLSGGVRAPRARGRASCSRDPSCSIVRWGMRPRVSPRACCPWTCQVRDLFSGVRSRVFVNVLARPVLCVLCSFYLRHLFS